MLQRASEAGLKLFLNLSIAVVVIIITVYITNRILPNMVQTRVMKVQRSISSVKQEISDIRSIGIQGKHIFFRLNQFQTVIKLNKQLHTLLVGFPDVVLLKFSELDPKTFSVKEALGVNMTKYARVGVQQVVATGYDIKLLGQFKPLYALLTDFSEQIKGVFWQSVRLKMDHYPKIVVDLKFYILRPK